MVGSGSSGSGGEEGFTGRAAIGYDHGYDAEVFYFGLALDPHYLDGWVEPTFRTPFCAFCELTIFLQNNTLLALDAKLYLQ